MGEAMWSRRPGPSAPTPGRVVGGATAWAAVARETHTSVILLIGDRAYKVKKPVALPFLDLSTRAARVANCRHEVELNRRVCPDVYLGIDELRELEGATGDSGEPVVVMRRMPDDRRLSALLADPARHEEARRCVLDAARQVAAFHASLPGLADRDLVGTLGRLWWEGRDQTRTFEADLLDADALDEAHALAAEYLAGRRGLLRARESEGRVRDGHGDLVVDDVFWLDDGARILDCLEFDEDLRVGDILMDVTFLAMDLRLHGADDLAALLLARYRELTDETHPASLAHHYVAYRAWVRAKVECLRSRSGDPGAAARAVAALDLCRSELRAGRVHLLLVGGLPATGKSTVARALVERDDRDWVLLSSDEVRKELAGVAPTSSQGAAFGEGLYDRAHTEAMYAEVFRRVAVALGRGVSVLLDATWGSAEARSRARQLAVVHSAALSEVRCVVDETTALARLASRSPGAQVSDADADVFRALAERADPWADALEIDTTGSIDETVDSILSAVRTRPVAAVATAAGRGAT